MCLGAPEKQKLAFSSATRLCMILQSQRKQVLRTWNTDQWRNWKNWGNWLRQLPQKTSLPRKCKTYTALASGPMTSNEMIPESRPPLICVMWQQHLVTLLFLVILKAGNCLRVCCWIKRVTGKWLWWELTVIFSAWHHPTRKVGFRKKLTSFTCKESEWNRAWSFDKFLPCICCAGATCLLTSARPLWSKPSIGDSIKGMDILQSHRAHVFHRWLMC